MTLTPLRRAVATAMTASASVPQFTLDARADASAALVYAHRGGVEDIVIAATARALARHRRLNASFVDGDIEEHTDINIGVAIAVDDGIVAPAIRGADLLTLQDIRTERRRLVETARRDGLRAAELYSATFTISNLGGYRIPRFHALVIPPQAAILAVGALNRRNRLWLSLSVDHRVTDGVPAARFLTDVVDTIEGALP